MIKITILTKLITGFFLTITRIEQTVYFLVQAYLPKRCGHKFIRKHCSFLTPFVKTPLSSFPFPPIISSSCSKEAQNTFVIKYIQVGSEKGCNMKYVFGQLLGFMKKAM